MRLTLCTTLLLLSVGLSGCFGGDDDPGTGGTVGGDAGADGDLGNITGGAGEVFASVNVSLTAVPEDVLAGQNTTFAWTLDGQAGNGTSVSTGIVWSSTAIGNDTTPDQAENHLVVAEDASVPGAFEANVSFESTGEYFVRTYALVSGNVTWSDEVNITVAAELVVKEVTIGSASLAATAPFSPETITIKVGEAVAWKNGDDESHHVVSSSGATIDTGVIAAGATSEPIVFEAAGTFAYECKLHDGFGVGHDGTVVVEE